MTNAPDRHFRVDMSDGLVIERLPLGFANGKVRLRFIASGPNFSLGDPPRAIDFMAEFRDRVSIEGVGTSLSYCSGSCVGGEDEQEVGFAYLANGAKSIRLQYVHDGSAVATEVLDVL